MGHSKYSLVLLNAFSLKCEFCRLFYHEIIFCTSTIKWSFFEPQSKKKQSGFRTLVEEKEKSTAYKAVCLTSATNDSNLELPQPVRVHWMESNLPNLETGHWFTYKPNPMILNIYPQNTVLRYHLFWLEANVQCLNVCLIPQQSAAFAVGSLAVVEFTLQ